MQSAPRHQKINGNLSERNTLVYPAMVSSNVMKTFYQTFLAIGLVATAVAQQRNVLLIIADDLGTDSLALYNSSPGAALPPTPNIDAIARDGPS